MTTLAKPRLEVQTINSNHPGAEFGVIHLGTTDTQLSLSECLAALSQDGWTAPEEIPCARPGIHKFLISRKK